MKCFCRPCGTRSPDLPTQGLRPGLTYAAPAELESWLFGCLTRTKKTHRVGLSSAQYGAARSSKPCLRSQSLKNRRSWKTLSTVSAGAPADLRADARLQPLPLLYRKTRPLRGECAKFPPK